MKKIIPSVILALATVAMFAFTIPDHSDRKVSVSTVYDNSDIAPAITEINHSASVVAKMHDIARDFKDTQSLKHLELPVVERVDKSVDLLLKLSEPDLKYAIETGLANDFIYNSVFSNHSNEQEPGVICGDWNPKTGCRICVVWGWPVLNCEECPYCPQDDI
ncbi:MAG: hypothetical protein EBW87_00180 [Burkholderiaceae bacterium]|nr:hypothetical protein [Burkholderiaceae bacterium]